MLMPFDEYLHLWCEEHFDESKGEYELGVWPETEPVSLDDVIQLVEQHEREYHQHEREYH
jgi:hypothetical protein